MGNLDLKLLQKDVKKWTDTKGFKWSAYAEFCHLVEEVGELGEALTVKHGEREAGSGSKGLADHSDMKEELGDVLFSLIVIANRFGIDLENCFNSTIRRYNKKIEKRGK
jgi:NTP pyrophosphatase (non-canonical NTP hydrolase)